MKKSRVKVHSRKKTKKLKSELKEEKEKYGKLVNAIKVIDDNKQALVGSAREAAVGANSLLHHGDGDSPQSSAMKSQPHLNNFVIIDDPSTHQAKVTSSSQTGISSIVSEAINPLVQSINSNHLLESPHSSHSLHDTQAVQPSETQQPVITGSHETRDNEPVIKHLESGYPVFNIPSSSNEVVIPDYHKPLPPLYGVNPYEALTSSELNGSAYKTEHYDADKVNLHPTYLTPLMRKDLTTSSIGNRRSQKRFLKNLKKHRKHRKRS